MLISSSSSLFVGMNSALIYHNFVMSEFLKGESFAKKDVMLMERRGMNVSSKFPYLLVSK